MSAREVSRERYYVTYTTAIALTGSHLSASLRHQYLAGSAIDVEQPEGGYVLLQDHRDHTDAGRKQIVASVLGMSRTDFSFAFDSEQDCGKGACRDGNLVGADISVGAVD